MKTMFVGACFLLVAGASAERPPKVDAEKVFKMLSGLTGQWEGTSKSGMKEKLDAKLIAQGSVLMETSSMGMATMYHRDGDRVLLTHYCMAKNQPRLQATSLSPDGKEITFTFLDGTGMKNRNVGHMDKVVMRVIDKDSYSAKWTWYEKGKHQWMEDVMFRRVVKPTAKVPGPPPAPSCHR